MLSFMTPIISYVVTRVAKNALKDEPKAETKKPQNRPIWEFAYPEKGVTVACSVFPTDKDGKPGATTTVCKKEGGEERFYGYLSTNGDRSVEIYKGKTTAKVEGDLVSSYIPYCEVQTRPDGSQATVCKKESSGSSVPGETGIYGFKNMTGSGFDFISVISKEKKAVTTEEGSITNRNGITEYHVSHVKTVSKERTVLDESSCSYSSEGALTESEGTCPVSVDHIPYRTE